MATGFLNKPCPGANSKGGAHDWRDSERVKSRDSTGRPTLTYKVKICINCGNQP